MTYYSSDDDLVLHRPDILNNGNVDFSWAHQLAYNEINTTIEADWYITEAPEHDIDPTSTGLDSTKLDADQLKEVAVYKVLELIYTSLSKDTPLDDGFYQWAAHYRTKYDQALDHVLRIGPNYDWGGDGSIDQDEKFLSRRRFQERG